MEELRQLGRYQLVRVLGRGAMGIVYEGIDPKLNRQVAVKTILKGQLIDPEMAAEYSKRFEREAQAVARLTHPNIVGVFDFGEENEVAYIVMELVRGEELKTYFDEKKIFSVAESVRMIGELLDALEYVHERGIVHRDIKPANIMLDAQMQVKLTDFGVARVSDTGGERTQVGTMVGTPSHMSPEQIQGFPVGSKTDIFATGIVLYQFLTARKPFTGEGVWAIQKKIIQDDPEPVSAINPALTPAFDAVIARALAKLPDQRYQSANEFKLDLQQALAGGLRDDGDATQLSLGSVQKVSLSANQSGAASQSGSSRNASNTEIEFWRSIKDSEDVQEFELYLEKFPFGAYADLAKRKLAKLAGESSGAFAGNSSRNPASVLSEATVLAPGQVNVSGAEIKNAEKIPVRQPEKPASANKFVLPAVFIAVSLAGIAGYIIYGKKSEPVSVNPAISSPSQVKAESFPSNPVKAEPKPVEALQSEMLKQPETAVKVAPDQTAHNKLQQDELQKKQIREAKLKEMAKKDGLRPAAPVKPELVKVPDAVPLSVPATPPPAAVAPAPPVVAAPVPVAVKPAPPVAEKPASVPDLMAQASKLESAGHVREAAKLYKRASSAGSGIAAKKLGDIYGNGQGDVARDYAESVRWYNLASDRGMTVPIASKR